MASTNGTIKRLVHEFGGRPPEDDLAGLEPHVSTSGPGPRFGRFRPRFHDAGH